MKNKFRILIADDHAIVRMGLSALIDAQPDMECVGEAIDGNDALAKVRACQPDIIIMDIMMPERDGISATLALSELVPSSKVLILTRIR